MFKRIKSILTAFLVAALSPALRTAGRSFVAQASPPVETKQASLPVEPQPASSPVDPLPVSPPVGPSPAGPLPLSPPQGAALLAAATAAGSPPGLNQRILDLEAELSARNVRILELEKVNAETASQTGRLEESLKIAVTGYKNLIILSNPDILPELISGETSQSLDSSLTKARELTGKVKTNLEAHARLTRIPAGAPARRPEDLSGLSSREKIQRGIKD